MKRYLFLLVLGAVVLVLFFARERLRIEEEPVKKEGSVCLRQHCLFVEIADTDQQRKYGLMFRRELAKNEGMLFLFEEQGIHSFWMKNMLIPLDIIWIDRGNTIVFLSRSVQPCSRGSCEMITPPVASQYVLEVRAGVAQRMELNVGEQLSMSIQ